MSAPDWYRGAVAVKSGVVFIPQGADLPPCPFPCKRCRKRGKQKEDDSP